MISHSSWSPPCQASLPSPLAQEMISHSLAQENVSCGSFLSHVSFEQDEETHGGGAGGGGRGSQPPRAGGSSQPGPTHAPQLMHKPGMPVMQKPMFMDDDSDDEVLDLGTFCAGAGGGSRGGGISLVDAQGKPMIGLRVVDTAVKPHLLQALQGLKEELQELKSKAPLLEASREAAAQELKASRKQLDFFAADNSAAAETDKTKVSQATVTHAVLPPGGGGGASNLPTVSLEASLVILPNNRGVNICQNTASSSLALHAQPCTPGTPSPVQPAILTSMGCGEARKLMQRLTPRVVAVTPVRQLLGHWERRAGLEVLQEDARGGRAFAEEERNKCLARGYTRRESIVFQSVLSEKYSISILNSRELTCENFDRC